MIELLLNLDLGELKPADNRTKKITSLILLIIP